MKIRRRLKVESRADLVPMIDIVFQLVVFFMISSVFNTTPGIQLDLPSSQTSETVQITRLVITVVSREEIYLNKEQYDLTGFREAMKRFKVTEEDQNQKEVVFAGDRKLPYDLMINILDVMRSNGYKGVNLKTLKNKVE